MDTQTERAFFTKEQKKQILAELNGGASVKSLQEKYNIPSTSTIYTWRKALKKKRVYRNVTKSITPDRTPKPPVNGELDQENQILRNLLVDIIIKYKPQLK